MARSLRLAAIVLLLGLCPARPARAESPPAPPQVRPAVERAAKYLQGECATWMSQRSCAACHHAAMPLWALGEAGRQGYAIDRKFVADTAAATMGSPAKLIASRVMPDPAAPPDPRPMGRGVSIGAAFLAAAVSQGLPSLDAGQRQSLRLIADDIVKKQQPDGSWEFFLSRPPINENQATDAAWVLLALQADAAAPDAPASHRAALEKGMTWLATAGPADNLQVKNLQLLLALRTGRPRAEPQPALDELFALQHPDGGWSQLPHTNSDAFATGQTLYTLALAGYTPDRPDLQRAIHFLTATQKPDGSWPMTSRASPDGKPGGSAKLLSPITCSATAWATLGLARVAPNGS